jgi:general secretion pathway protein M
VNHRLSPRLSRALALTLLAALVWLAYSWLIQPALEDYAAARAAAARLAPALARAGRGDDDLGALTAELARLKQNRPTTEGFLRSANESLAAAELQGRLNSSVAAARGELRSAQILAARDEGAFRRVSIRGQIAVTMPQLQRILYDLEAGSPFLFLDNVDIRTRQAPPVRGRAEDESVLEVRFDLYGYMRRTL